MASKCPKQVWLQPDNVEYIRRDIHDVILGIYRIKRISDEMAQKIDQDWLNEINETRLPT